MFFSPFAHIILLLNLFLQTIINQVIFIFWFYTFKVFIKLVYYVALEIFVVSKITSRWCLKKKKVVSISVSYAEKQIRIIISFFIYFLTIYFWLHKFLVYDVEIRMKQGFSYAKAYENLNCKRPWNKDYEIKSMKERV